MANHDNAKHISEARKIKRKVFFQGTADTVFSVGQGVCYNRDYGTATTKEGRRDNYVEVPSKTNNRCFAGVLDHNVTMPSTGGTWVTINEPGSVCEVALGIDTVVNTGLITCLAGGGDNTAVFADAGFKGRGSAIPMETVTAVLESVKTGAGVMTATGLTLTVTDSSDFVVGSTKVLILAGENDGTGKAVPGLYDIDSITSAVAIVLADAAVDTTAAGTISCSYVVIDGANKTGLAYLLDGDESGLSDWITPPNAGGDNLAYMVGGFTRVNGGVTVAADSEVELAEETVYGMKKGFLCMGTLGTSDFVIDLVSAGYTMTGGALNEVNGIDAATEGAILEWNGKWRCVSLLGGAEA